MIHVELDLDDLDFDALIDRFLPTLAQQLTAAGNPLGALLSNSMTSSMAKGVLHALSQDKKEELAVNLINGNQAMISEKIQNAVQQQNLHLHIAGIQASTTV